MAATFQRAARPVVVTPLSASPIIQFWTLFSTLRVADI